MVKENLTMENIRRDLQKVAWLNEERVSDSHFNYIIPCTILSLLIGILFELVFVAVVIFSFAAYHIVLFSIECRHVSEIRKEIKKDLERGDISVSVQKLTNIVDETIYEPHAGRRGYHNTKDIKVFVFASGIRWRVPNIYKHYEWSLNCYMSTQGLENTSVCDDEFYFVMLQGHTNISYVYNTKFFDFNEE